MKMGSRWEIYLSYVVGKKKCHAIGDGNFIDGFQSLGDDSENFMMVFSRLALRCLGTQILPNPLKLCIGILNGSVLSWH